MDLYPTECFYAFRLRPKDMEDVPRRPRLRGGRDGQPWTVRRRARQGRTLALGACQARGGQPEFFHPSFREYFFALGLSKTSDEELARFVEENYSDDGLAEVLAFLVRLLEDEGRQALVLDRL